MNPDETDNLPILIEERRFFAALAMQGLLAGQSTGSTRQPAEAVAEWSVQYADALIERLNNDPPTPRVHK